jgi:hypothetical protein
MENERTFEERVNSCERLKETMIFCGDCEANLLCGEYCDKALEIRGD